MTPEYKYRVHYRSNYDGDTIRFDFDLGLGIWNKGEAGNGVAVRLAGLDTPELRGDEKEAGMTSKLFVEGALSTAEDIVVETFKDKSGKYGRYIANVYYYTEANDDWVCLNDQLIDLGYAEEVNYG